MKPTFRFPFLPFGAKYPGVVFMLFGVIGLYFFGYQNYKPDWLQFNVFTAYSYFLSAKTFTFIKNNQGDEISTLLFFLGAFLLMASAEKNEKPVHRANRTKAMAWAAWTTMFAFLAGYLFLHGLAVVYFSLILPYLVPLFYLAGFYILNKKLDAWEV